MWRTVIWEAPHYYILPLLSHPPHLLPYTIDAHLPSSRTNPSSCLCWTILAYSLSSTYSKTASSFSNSSSAHTPVSLPRLYTHYGSLVGFNSKAANYLIFSRAEAFPLLFLSLLLLLEARGSISPPIERCMQRSYPVGTGAGRRHSLPSDILK